MKSPPWTIQKHLTPRFICFIACFVIFCKTDADLKEPLEQILRIIERENKVFPIFTFNRHLKQAHEFSHSCVNATYCTEVMVDTIYPLQNTDLRSDLTRFL